MRNKLFLLAAFSVISLASAANADDDMKMPDPAKPMAVAPKPGKPQQKPGVQQDSQAMHDQMMKDHAAGIAAMKDSPPQSGMKMGCGDQPDCKDKKMPAMGCDKAADPAMPAPAPMPMKDHM